MLALQDQDAVVVDYWHEIARRGVLSLAFFIQGSAGQTWMASDLIGPRTGMVLRSALAAQAIDKAIAEEAGSPAWVLRYGLSHNLQAGAADADLAAYRALLIERLHEAIKAGPAEVLTRLPRPDAPTDRYGRS